MDADKRTPESPSVGEEYLLDTVPRSPDELEMARSMRRWRDPKRMPRKPVPAAPPEASQPALGSGEDS